MEFVDLPNEIYFEIGERLTGIDLINFKLINKALCKYIKSNTYIEEVLQESFSQLKQSFDNSYYKIVNNINYNSIEYKSVASGVRCICIYKQLPKNYGNVSVDFNNLSKRIKKGYNFTGHIRLDDKVNDFWGNFNNGIHIEIFNVHYKVLFNDNCVLATIMK